MSDTAIRSHERDLLTDPKGAARALGAIARRLGHEAGVALLEEIEERTLGNWRARQAEVMNEAICCADDRPATRQMVAVSAAILALTDERHAMEREAERARALDRAAAVGERHGVGGR